MKDSTLVIGLLIIINFISVIVILSVNFYPVINTTFDDKTINNINDIYKNLSYSIIGATVFYLVIDRLPYLLKKIKTRKVFSDNIFCLNNSLDSLFLYLNKEYFGNKIDKELFALSSNDFSRINRTSTISKVVVIKTEKSVDKTYMSGVAFFIDIGVDIKKEINVIYENPLCGLLETELLIIIHNIFNSKIFELNKYYDEINSQSFKEADIPFEIDVEFFKLYNEYLKLRNHRFVRN
ncbi:hypothetical protein HX017_10715 [Myroides marinus]|uniref:hypothetical protein n=1 Tax=Myroides marinus TaxID=703342 RepID=UPI0025788BAC|nr:hypothetical protein [Myroides marinus]MDM1347547.1 hypothetical protein [Myroides marinus]MDM1350801.1 hypothetical protein [Myroides marinus]MDM1355276.1 hypothetical protein [Myroides marinus]MDM1358008.1 hypothetical protein [Myroides marinus]MDM1363246.1 hypothetical protein [Myroides marinus]